MAPPLKLNFHSIEMIHQCVLFFKLRISSIGCWISEDPLAPAPTDFMKWIGGPNPWIGSFGYDANAKVNPTVDGLQAIAGWIRGGFKPILEVLTAVKCSPDYQPTSRLKLNGDRITDDHQKSRRIPRRVAQRLKRSNKESAQNGR